jgi:hypothetical protein
MIESQISAGKVVTSPNLRLYWILESCAFLLPQERLSFKYHLASVLGA